MQNLNALSAIESLTGMEEFKSFCGRLSQTAANARKLRLESIPLPNLIFAAEPGSGTTMHIRLLSELFREQKLMRFMGEEAYFEWLLTDEQESINKLILRTKRAAGFYGEFRGVIGLDIGALLAEREEVPPLARLMEYVASQKGKILFVFTIPLKTAPEMQKQLVGRFASYTPVELIHMPFPMEEAQYYVTDQLFSQGFDVSAAAQSILKQAVRKTSESPNFEGYQTLQNLADVIVWRKISQLPPVDDRITESDVQFVLAPDGFCAVLNVHGVRTAMRRMGFGEGR